MSDYVVHALFALSLAACVELPSDSSPREPLGQSARGATNGQSICGRRLDGGPKLLSTAPSGSTWLLQSDDRIVSQAADTWLLWDRASGMLIAEGKLAAATTHVDLVDDTLLTTTATNLALRSAQDGTVERVIALPTTPVASGLSRDGRYVYALDRRAIRAWDRSGTLQAERAVSGMETLPSWKERVYAASDELRIVGAAPENRVETLSMVDGTTRVGDARPVGEFVAWFLDGSHFVTAERIENGTLLMLHVHAKDGAHRYAIGRRTRLSLFDSVAGTAGGDGEHLWVDDFTDATGYSRGIIVYRLGAAEPVLKFEGRPRATTERAVAHAFAKSVGTLRLLDLRGSDPQVTDYAFDTDDMARVTTDAKGRWVSSSGGALHDGAPMISGGKPRAFGCGPMRVMAGWKDTLAVATADHVTRLFSLKTGAPKMMASIEGIDAKQVEFAKDGRLMVLRGRVDGMPWGSDSATQIFALDDDLRPTLRWQIPFVVATDSSVSLAEDGSRIALAACRHRSGGADCFSDIYDLAGSEAQRSIHLDRVAAVSLAPSGTRYALPGHIAGTNRSQTTIFDNGQATRALSDLYGLLWIDDAHLLANESASNVPTVQVVDLTGRPVVTLEGPLTGRPRKASTALLHDARSVFRLSDGKCLWNTMREGGLPAPGWYKPEVTVAGRQVVVDRADGVYVEPLRNLDL